MPMAVVDFHSHILPRIDDGSRSTEMTAEMLSNAAVQGIDIMVATPHFYADSTTIDRFLRHRERAYLATQPIAEAKKIQVICGAEVAFFPGMSRADDIEQLCIGDTSLMMVEMPFRAWTDRDLREMELMLNRGIQPVIAHLERFYRFQEDRGMIPALVDMPVYVQINAECLLRWSTRGQALRLFRNGEAHLLGSDCHNVSSRPENLKEGRSVLSKKLGELILRQMDDLSSSLVGVE